MEADDSILPLVIILGPMFAALITVLTISIKQHARNLRKTTEWFEHELGAKIKKRPGLLGPKLSAVAVVDDIPVKIEQVNERRGADKFEAIRFKVPHEFDFQSMVIEKKKSYLRAFRLSSSRDIGKPELQSKLDLQGSKECLTKFFASAERTRIIKRMVRLGMSKLVVTPQEMIAYSRYLGQRPERYEKLIKELTRLATGHQIAMSVENKVSTDAQQTQTCPFCRDSLEVDLEPTTHCEHCGTAHHEECYEEAGGCTVFACRPAKPQRQKAKA